MRICFSLCTLCQVNEAANDELTGNVEEERQLLNLLFPTAATTTTINPLNAIGGAIGGLLGVTTTTPAATTTAAKFNPVMSILQLVQGLISAGVITTPSLASAASNPLTLLTQALTLLG
jgi:hypothetical protein